jgi:hypothetical protein
MPTTSCPAPISNVSLIILALFLIFGTLISHLSETLPDLRRNRHLKAVLDPKSVEAKEHLHVQNASNASATSKLPHQNTSLIPGENEFQHLRFLFMGTSRSYGVHLHDRLHQAFPFLISPNATNLAIPGSTPPFATKCTYSMVHPVEQDDSFDVIVLEYETYVPSVLSLVKRLRKRYPEAHIIVTEMWLLKRFVHSRTGKDMGTFASKLTWATNEMEAEVAAAIVKSTKTTDWRYTGSVYSDRLVQALKNLGNVAVLKPEVPVNGHEAITKGYQLFLGDMHHYSRGGHVLMASMILNHLRDISFRTHHDSTLEPWDERDQCESWFRSGTTNTQHDRKFVMNEYAKGKFALEALSTENWIRVYNNGSEPRGFAIERLVAAPDCRYPDTNISIVGNPQQVLSGCQKESSPWPWQVNVAQELYIGEIPPGQSTIFFKSLEEGKPWPFRIVGYSISKREMGENIAKYIPGSMDCKLDKVLNKIQCT